MKNKKIIFVLDSISQPRCLKRIKGFISNGYEVEIYGYDRGVYNVNTKIIDKEINVLGYAISGKGYLRKFLTSFVHLIKIFWKYRKEDVLYYFFGYDHAVVASIFRRKKYIYEVGDLMYTYFNSPLIRSILKFFDKLNIKGSVLTVLITSGMVEYLFNNKPYRNIIIQPNKVDNSMLNWERKPKFIHQEETTISFGFAGAIRYKDTVSRFARIIGEKFPQHKFIFHGDATDTNDVKQLTETFKNVFYYGEYRNPLDLQKIYSTIDIVVACYETNTINEIIAEPNKLYESLFFCKPIIVSQNTHMSNFVCSHNFGFKVNALDDHEIYKLVNGISIQKLNEIIKNIKDYPMENLVDDNNQVIISFLEKYYELIERKTKKQF